MIAIINMKIAFELIFLMPKNTWEIFPVMTMKVKKQIIKQITSVLSKDLWFLNFFNHFVFLFGNTCMIKHKVIYNEIKIRKNPKVNRQTIIIYEFIDLGSLVIKELIKYSYSKQAAVKIIEKIINLQLFSIILILCEL